MPVTLKRSILHYLQVICSEEYNTSSEHSPTRSLSDVIRSGISNSSVNLLLRYLIRKIKYPPPNAMRTTAMTPDATASAAPAPSLEETPDSACTSVVTMSEKVVPFAAVVDTATVFSVNVGAVSGSSEYVTEGPITGVLPVDREVIASPRLLELGGSVGVGDDLPTMVLPQAVVVQGGVTHHPAHPTNKEIARMKTK